MMNPSVPFKACCDYLIEQMCVCVRYQIEDVAKACCDYLTKNLEPANVIGIARFAEEIGCTELHLRSREYINTHFNEVGTTHTLCISFT